MRIRSASQTHIGRVRRNNEDALLCDDEARRYAVADGMGGHAAGEIASRIAIETLRATPDARKISDVFCTAHAAILYNTQQHPKRAGMGTTMTVLSILPDIAVLGHVGDSRCYLVRGGVGLQLTSDHLYEPNRLSNCLGGSRDGYRGLELRTIALRTDDMIILCTDGLSNYVNATAAAKLVGHRRSRTPSSKLEQSIANHLINSALEAGGSDNATVIVLSVSGD